MKKKTTKQPKSPGKAPIDPAAIKRALAEDAPKGDITTKATIGPGAVCTARLVAKEDIVLSGLDLFAAVFRAADGKMRVRKRFKDGDTAPKGAVVATVSGPARAALTGERVALNFLQHMCGVATLTRKFVKAVEGTGAVILDTRKTAPGFRDLDKYAVRCGGGANHRRGLSDMALIKENHIAVAGGIAEAVDRVRKTVGLKGFVEVEVESLAQLDEAIEAGADRVMLDNMTPAQVKKAVARAAGRVETEASGNMSLKNVGAYGRAGVDYISVGALTHSPPAADLSLLIDKIK